MFIFNLLSLIDVDKFSIELQKVRRLSAIMFYLHFFLTFQVSYTVGIRCISEVFYLDCVGIYMAFKFAASPTF